MTAPGGTDRAQRHHAKNIVLVGAGHAHLYALRRAREFARRGLGLTVIAPEDFWYSGLATGVLGGIYPASLDRIDVAALIAGSGAKLVRVPMSGLDLEERRVFLEDGSSIGFGSLSLNLGSTVPAIPGAGEEIFSAKPVTRLIALRAALEAKFRNEPDGPTKVAIVGGGTTGCEIAASIRDLARRRNATADLTVFTSDRALANLPPAAAERVDEHLRTLEIDIRVGVRVERIERARVVLTDSASEPFDYIVNATGLQPPPLTRSIGLATDDGGAIVVDDRLMSISADGVFAAGDCIAIEGGALPRVGVYAIRQSPILFHNLMAFLDGAPLKRFSPQKNYLSVMTLGGGNGFARRNGFWSLGRAAFLIKDWIDRRFLRNYQPNRPENGGSENPETDYGLNHRRGRSSVGLSQRPKKSGVIQK